MKDFFYGQAREAVAAGDADKAAELARAALAAGVAANELLEEALIPAITEVGDSFGREEIFLPELLLAAEAMHAAVELCKAAMPEGESTSKGRVLIGTVEGDIHDIGKTIVASFLGANGFEVIDAGRDVPARIFIEKAVEHEVDVIATSALLTTTMPCQRELEEELKAQGLRERFLTIVGGAPVDQSWADEIEADGFAEDAASAVKLVARLLDKS